MRTDAEIEAARDAVFARCHPAGGGVYAGPNA